MSQRDDNIASNGTCLNFVKTSLCVALPIQTVTRVIGKTSKFVTKDGVTCWGFTEAQIAQLSK
jgi:aspartate aminotransferase-like enzyme